MTVTTANNARDAEARDANENIFPEQRNEPRRTNNDPRANKQQQTKRDRRDVHGWIVLDKPIGMTSTHAVADILSQGSVHDPDLEGHIITVPEVRMSPDLKLATVYVMPLGGRDTEIVLAALERNKKFLRGEIAHRVNLKFAPDIRFRADERFDEAERIEKLLRTPAVQRDLAPEKGDEE